jgi:zinc and cadmium transporter
MTLAICVHKLPEGLALGALLLGAGFSRAKMMRYVVAVQSATLFGGILGWFVLRQVSGFWVELVVAHAGGGFIYLALHAVLGEILKHHKTLVLASFATGFGVIATLILIFHL